MPGIMIVGWWCVLELEKLVLNDDDEVKVDVGEERDDDDDRGRFRLRKDIWYLCMYYMVKVAGVELYKLVLFVVRLIM